uniref:Secreted protein n=1 Tax=Ditylenchus dipsaci TaxID=166011 RepID=A0A915DM61_9BILA
MQGLLAKRLPAWHNAAAGCIAATAAACTAIDPTLKGKRGSSSVLPSACTRYEAFWAALLVLAECYCW